MTSGGTPPPVPGPGGPQGWPPPEPFPAPGAPSAPQPPAGTGGYPPGAYPAYPAYPGAYPTYPASPGAYPGQPGGWPPVAPVRPSRWRKVLPTIVAVVVAAAAGGGYAIYRDHHPKPENSQASAAGEAGQGDCEVPGARLVTLQKKTPREPTVQVPLTAGWTELDFRKETWLGKRLKSIRGFFANPSIRQDDYTPDLSINVYLSTDPPEAVLTKIFDTVTENTVTDRVTESGCGTTLYRADFSAPDYFRPGTQPADGTTVVEILEGDPGYWYVVEANISTKHPENPSYIAQRDALLKGLRVSF